MPVPANSRPCKLKRHEDTFVMLRVDADSTVVNGDQPVPVGIRLRADLRAASDRYLSALSGGQIAAEVRHGSDRSCDVPPRRYPRTPGDCPRPGSCRGCARGVASESLYFAAVPASRGWRSTRVFNEPRPDSRASRIAVSSACEFGHRIGLSRRLVEQFEVRHLVQKSLRCTF